MHACFVTTVLTVVAQVGNIYSSAEAAAKPTPESEDTYRIHCPKTAKIGILLF